MKKVFSVVFFVMILMSSSLSAHADTLQIKVDDVLLNSDVEPEIINSQTMVPVRVISENLGATVKWSAPVVTLTKNNLEVQLTLQNHTAIKNDKAVQLDTKPYIKNERTMVPIRFIAETFNSQVSYKNSLVTVNTEPLVINDEEVKALQFEEHMTMGSVVHETIAKAYYQVIYDILIENKGEKVDEPENYSTRYNSSSPGNYTQFKQYDFLNQEGNSIKRFEIYTLVDEFPEELLEGYPEVLLYDATENQWYLFNDDATQSIEDLIKEASNNGYVDEVSNTAA
ncbi:copper amine oxidase N-terminal domain-containing protein [Filobacillus milosensis]|uniref:Copper amine oxidase N-terminal domain-containing protein n=1 Tax=Filobacillus milosensis TaxID=94137 RepID=A0A4Y8IFY1_9BACI|nr:copper amine oxidase N-terminal domain-containing protein [Filobacillus milosensis]TFB19579.1 copper amine oxidase N-terminal domain-containing protein [Filobacillus milosensis]